MAAKKKPHRRLSLKQSMFISAYLGEANGNATEAAKLAGYTGNRNTLKAMGQENLTKPYIKAEIDREVRGRKCMMSKADRIELLSQFAEDPTLDVKDRMKAMELLGRMNGDFVLHRRNVSNINHLIELDTTQLEQMVARKLGPELVKPRLIAAVEKDKKKQIDATFQ